MGQWVVGHVPVLCLYNVKISDLIFPKTCRLFRQACQSYQGGPMVREFLIGQGSQGYCGFPVVCSVLLQFR